MTQHHVGLVSVRFLLPPPLPPPSLSLRPGTVATSPSPLLRDVGWPFYVRWGFTYQWGTREVEDE